MMKAEADVTAIPAPIPTAPPIPPPTAPPIPTVHLMTGLPASGKSTHARKLMAEAGGRMRRVSLDDLRLMLDDNPGGRRLTYAHEETVLAVQDAAVLAAVKGGFDIVVDNTHLKATIPNRLKKLVNGQAVFEVHDFTDIDVEECVRRDAARPNPVGEGHIRAMNLRLRSARSSGWRLTAAMLNDIAPIQPYVADWSLPAAVLCDIDGTLAGRGARGPYELEKCELDALIPATAHALKAFAAQGDRIILLSGRGEEVRAHTERWLAANGVRYDEMWMRAAGDQRGDDTVKGELFDAHIRHRYAARVVLDDRDRLIALWRDRLGLPCWQVDYGDF